MPTLAELKQSNVEPEPLTESRYVGNTTYMGQKIAMNYHPTHYVKTMLNILHKTHFAGLGVIAPPGHGKTSMVQTLLHHIHTYEPGPKEPPKLDFNIVWAGAKEFKNQKKFYEKLPKKNTIIVFDDVSGAAKELGEKGASEAFASLTKILHTLGKSNHAIVICLFHYSKSIPKDFRAQFMHKYWLVMSDEEKTNLKHMFDKGSRSYETMIKYARLYQQMMEWNGFDLKISKHQKEHYTTDKPFRVAGVSTESWASVMLYGLEKCHICMPPSKTKNVSIPVLFQEIYKAYGSDAIKMMQYKLYEQGYLGAIPKNLIYAFRLWDKIFADYTADYSKLEGMVLRHTRQKKTTRLREPKIQQQEIYETIGRTAESGIMDSHTVENIALGMTMLE